MRVLAQKLKATRQTPSASSATRAQASSQARGPHSILRLQRTIGNQALQRLLHANAGAGTRPAGAPRVQRKCAACEEGGEACPHCAGEEAVQAAPASVDRLTVQRQPALATTIEEEDKGAVQAKEAFPGATALAPAASARLGALRGTGAALPQPVREFFEPRFGADFGQVRVHTDPEAGEIARSLQAKAFTVGGDVFFAPGQYAPDTTGGKRLLAHELTHVVQQGAGGRTAGPAAPGRSLTQSAGAQVMREGFESTFEVCRRVLTTRTFNVKNGGVRVVLLLHGVDKSVVDCEDFTFGVTLTREVDWWGDDEIGTCRAATGGPRSFSFGNVAPGTYYLTIWRSFDHPYCCLSGDILVFDEPVSGDSGGCERDEDPTVMDIIHGALDVAGFIPVLGAVPDGINAAIYAVEGDWTNAGISAAAMVPLFGDGAKLVVKGGKEVIEASGKTIVKTGEEELARRLKKAAAEAAEKKAAGTEAREAAEKWRKEAAEKRLKQKIAKCEALHAAYKALEPCPKCKKTDAATERAAKIACITAVLAGRKKYLEERCDYVLEGSIRKGSATAERGHRERVAAMVNQLTRCTTLPTGIVP